MSKKLFVIGIISATSLIVAQDNITNQKPLEIVPNPDNPPELGFELITDANGVSSAGPDILWYNNFTDTRPEIMDTEEWDSLCQTKYQWTGFGTSSSIRHSKLHPHMIFLDTFQEAVQRPREMNPEFNDKVFAFRAGTLPIQVEPLVPWGYIEKIERLDKGYLLVTAVSTSEDIWNDFDSGARKHTLTISEESLLQLWNIGELTHEMLTKACDLEDFKLLPQYPPRPVPEPVFAILGKTTIHPLAASYTIEEDGTIISYKDAVLKEFTLTLVSNNG